MTSLRPPLQTQSQVPFVVERYAVYDSFASGGMATVHFARVLGAQGFRRTVAVKRLFPHLLLDRTLATHFAEEARLAARVSHPNAVATLDVVQSAGELLLVMEYVHGESLAKLMHASAQRGESIPLPIATAIIVDALHGLHAAHTSKDERGHALELVHRDVSPQNVLVGSDGITRIADFGIAKAAGLPPLTREGVIKGKLGYMAPEQINEGAAARTTDVFAAGVVLWELLAGERLFGGSTQAEVAFKVVAAPIAPPSTRNAAVPAELDAVVLRALARDPTARYPTAREMALALEASTPSARPSELAAWVERVGADSLREHAEALRTIERLDRTSGCADRALGLPAPARASAVQARPETHGTTARGPIPAQAGALGPLSASAAPSERRRPSRQARAARVALVLGALATLGTSAARQGEREPPAPSAGAVPSMDEETPSSAPSKVVVRPSPAPSVGVMPREAVDAAALTRPPSAHTPSPAKKTSKERGRANCDRPYSIDGTGKVLFKLECM